MGGLIPALRKNHCNRIFFGSILSCIPSFTVLFTSLSSWFQRYLLFQCTHSVTLNYFLNSERHRWIVSLITKLKIHLSNWCLWWVKISTQAECLYFLRLAEYLQRKCEAQQHKLKVEKQLVSKLPNIRGHQEFSHAFSIHKYSWILKSKFIPHRWLRLFSTFPGF